MAHQANIGRAVRTAKLPLSPNLEVAAMREVADPQGVHLEGQVPLTGLDRLRPVAMKCSVVNLTTALEMRIRMKPVSNVVSITLPISVILITNMLTSCAQTVKIITTALSNARP